MHGGDIYNNSVDMDFSVNLNPYPKFIKDEAALKTAIDEGIRAAVNYPDIAQGGVRNAIAEAERLPASCVYAGSGASELLMAVTSLIKPKKALLIEPCYSGYKHALGDCEIKRYVLKEENGFEWDEKVTDEVTGMLSADIDIVFLQNPVNPTGNCVDRALIYKIIKKAESLNITVVYDLSFYMLSDDSDAKGGISEIPDNVFAIGSYTKSFALPGLRMGYVMAARKNIDAIIPYLPEWNLSSVATSVMKECASICKRGMYLSESREYIRNEREFLSGELTKLGFKVYKSNTVFLLVKDINGRYGNLYERLLDKRILIRKCDDFCGLDNEHYRIAVRTHEENQTLIDEIRQMTYEY
ncbi:MAG: aminotransferase class I/II-fold pyridoxal phosphate-dependent enzyme [Lachnospiraceae bacterium]|nr:aminotransferase class I/II-fold pyridoxal phosphate-dependent enzyme [Lachnospiraceae bacterium]